MRYLHGITTLYFNNDKKTSIPFGNRMLDINSHECKVITFSLEKTYSTHSFPRIFPGELDLHQEVFRIMLINSYLRNTLTIGDQHM